MSTIAPSTMTEERAVNAIFGKEREFGLSLLAAFGEERLQGASEGAFMIDVELAELMQGVVVSLDRGVAWFHGQGEERTFVGSDITPEFLCSIFKQHMHVQAETLVQPYTGMWMRISGNLDNVIPVNDKTVMVRFDYKLPGPNPAMFF